MKAPRICFSSASSTQLKALGRLSIVCKQNLGGANKASGQRHLLSTRLKAAHALTIWSIFWPDGQKILFTRWSKDSLLNATQGPSAGAAIGPRSPILLIKTAIAAITAMGGSSGSSSSSGSRSSRSSSSSSRSGDAMITKCSSSSSSEAMITK